MAAGRGWGSWERRRSAPGALGSPGAARTVWGSLCFAVRWALITCVFLEQLPFSHLMFADRIGRMYNGRTQERGEYLLFPSHLPSFFSEWKERNATGA